MPPSLEKYANSSEELVGIKAFLGSDNSSNPVGVSYLTEQVLNKQIQEIQVDIPFVHFLFICV